MIQIYLGIYLQDYKKKGNKMRLKNKIKRTLLDRSIYMLKVVIFN